MSEELYADPELIQFYDLENGWAADNEYCFKIAESARSVLDIGCGTGLFAASLGEGRRVVGVDPAAAMLDVARGRPGGEHVQWIEADARSVRLGERFDLIVMIGHAFQCLLTDEDQLALFRTIATHLAPGGGFVFDSRNPEGEPWRKWTPEASRRTFEHPHLGTIEAWNDVEYDPATGIASYETFYRLPGSERQWHAPRSRIRFAAKDELPERMKEAGLAVDRWLGDWQGSQFQAGCQEIIPLGSHYLPFA